MEKDPKVNQFSIQAKNSTSTSGFEEMFIIKSNFKEFILVTDDLETEKIDNAIIEIITPVLKKESIDGLESIMENHIRLI